MKRIKYKQKSIEVSLKVNSSLDETAFKFLFEVQDILLKTFSFLHLPTFDVVLDVLLINLITSQFAKIILGLSDHLDVI